MRLRLFPALTLLALAVSACVPAGPSRPWGVPVAPVDQYLPGPGASNPQATRITPGGALPGPTLPSAEATGSGAERAYVEALFRNLQPRSIRENREYCGYVGLNAAGELISTPPNRGVEAGCYLPQVPAGMTVLASFHTHSTYSPLYASEWPTSQDVLNDAQSGTDGYVATPGGRLWFVDGDTRTVRELCGRYCLPHDPNYVPADDGPLRPVMTLDYLFQFERGLLRS